MQTTVFMAGMSLFIFLLWFLIVSLAEKELLAVKRLLLIITCCAVSFLGLVFHPYLMDTPVFLVVLGLAFLVLLLLLLPIKGNFKLRHEIPLHRFDERDTMFSRNEISHRPKLQADYYKNNADKLHIDKEWQAKPGLMSANSSMYTPLTFAAADAGFFPIEQLRPFVNGAVNKEKMTFADKSLTTFITNWSKKMGAVSVGFCQMEDYHYYSVRGRGEAYNQKVEPKHPFGIALTVEMDKEWLAAGPAGSALMESAREYVNSGIIAIQVAQFIRNLGYEARAHIDGNYEVICPLVGRDAGLGEIGRMGLLMTPELGPRVRIAVVSTTLPLAITPRKPDYSVHHFCTLCKKCAQVCPSQAISKKDIQTTNGVQRWQVNHEKCFSYWCTSGTDCGRCMSICPYSHPNNYLHNLVRWGIKHNIIFRKLALAMDDFFYGRKPTPAKMPEWMNPE